MMIVVVVVYALCWLPLHVITLLGELRHTIWTYRHIQTVWNGCHWLAMSSCCWNPIIYCWTNDSFRAGLAYALLGRCPCRSIRRRASRRLMAAAVVAGGQPTAAPPLLLAPASVVAAMLPPGAVQTPGRGDDAVGQASTSSASRTGGGQRTGAVSAAAELVAVSRQYASVESVLMTSRSPSPIVREQQRPLSTTAIGRPTTTVTVAAATAAAGATRRAPLTCRPSIARKLNVSRPQHHRNHRNHHHPSNI